MPRRTLSVLLAMLFLCALPSAPGATQPLRIGYIPIADCLQLYVAMEQGFFTAEGLEVQARPMQGGPVLSLAVEAGELDLGWSNMVSLFQAHARGFSFVLVAPGALEDDGEHLTHSLLVPGGSPLQAIGDLAGRTVAVNALGNVNDLSLTVLLAAAGQDPQSVRMVEVPFPDMEAALASGSVDAALVAEPFLSSAVSHGARCLVAAPHAVFGREFMIAGWFATSGWTAANPGQAAAFCRAVDKASAYITGHSQDIPGVLARHTRLTPDMAAHIALPAFSAGLDQAAMQRTIDLTATHGFIPRAFPTRDILAPGFEWPQR
ncbi:ABC transporter substrate-binding protein [Desulfovibrio sulfodismutans]|uniref:ABC transporter substrate-binding protein n=1 Tax=Desulfolutivibrio sulfodismutans TaxID=63561 RepID=A0A7K3NGY8_9BACT|nr:ABC transporter substrate-binding protein [Desulfolutivibrio sulfodismutans]QLA14484.1 ABC transporter substrate-binding protein [Desulfolutivibrio sulfodismutans DSM 3696]